jgi:hypothetical protein
VGKRIVLVLCISFVITSLVNVARCGSDALLTCTARALLRNARALLRNARALLRNARALLRNARAWREVVSGGKL